jgi:ubiquinone/menaquinone biosynthesis C-methylase UbiE
MKINLPYIDLIFELVEDINPVYKNAFGTNMHWGYWDNPKLSLISCEEFVNASSRLNEVFLSFADFRSGETVIDVGCGFGGTIQSIDKKNKHLKIFGINIDRRQIERAENSISPKSENDIKFLLSDACNLPFDNESVDTILALESIFHIKDRELFFKEAKRVLKIGGKLIFTDFIPNTILLPTTNLISKNSSLSGFFGDIYATYSEHDYQDLARRIGFTSKVNLDITENTLPTYSFLFMIGKDLAFRVPNAIIPTFLLFNFSITKFIKYKIFSYIKN